MKIEENEIIMLILGFSVLLYILKYRNNIRKIPVYRALLTAYFSFLGAALATTIEECFLHTFFNYFEHLCYLLSSLSLAYWSWRTSEFRDQNL